MEHGGEHALGLEGIRQVHDDAFPLFGEPFVLVVGVSARPGGPSLEIQEGVADGVLIAAVRVLPVEHRLVTVDADALFAVRKNAESAQG